MQRTTLGNGTLPQAEFAYNSSVCRSTVRALLKFVYGWIPNQITNVSTHPQVSDDAIAFAENLKEIQESVRQKLLQMNKHYKEAADRHR